MAKPTELTRHIESYVNSSATPTDQATSLDAIGFLVKTDALTIESLVKELEMYLTTTDDVVRARGILLLSEVLTLIESKPLSSATIHSLVGFFKDRLADWKALRGSLVGCLALIRRKGAVGAVTGSDAKSIAQSFLEYLQVQSLGQYDRKLCFELLDCLLQCYFDVVAPLGEHLIYGICEAIDAEKDPDCLMLAFHIVESLGQLNPDPSGLLASFAKDLFDILEAYFPIHFTHPTGGDTPVQIHDLSRALMSAFSAIPLFEPFVIPLLLEKLSSSLPSAQIESLRYLRSCSSKYGAEKIGKYARTIWSSLKNIISAYLGEPDFSFTGAPVYGIGFPENEFVVEALSLLQLLIVQNSSLLVSLIVDDEDFNIIFNIVAPCEKYDSIPVHEKKKLRVVGRILYVTAKTSISSCNAVFQSIFSRIMDNLGFSVSNIDSSANGDIFPTQRVKFGFLYLCIELLAGCMELTAVSKKPALQYVLEHEKCCTILHNFSTPLFNAFGSVLAVSSDVCSHDPDIYIGVKGLQILAMFCLDGFPISISMFTNILRKFMSIIMEDFNKTILWEAALKALFHIGSSVHKFHESEKATSYSSLVVEKIVELLSLDDISLPFTLKLEALSVIGMTGTKNMLIVLQGLAGAVFGNLSEVHRNLKSLETAVQLLQCYSCKLLPWIHENGGSEDFVVQFAVDIWSQAGNCMDFSTPFEGKDLLDAMMKVMKLSVASCSVESQNTITQKANSVLSSNSNFQLNELDRLPLTPGKYDIPLRDEWILSLFASVIIAVSPKTCIPNIRVLLHLFMKTLLKGVVPVAQALGSMINKLLSNSNDAEISSDLTLEEALDFIFNTKIWFSSTDLLQRCNGTSNGKEMVLTDLCLGISNDRSLQINALCGLSWIGKGLLLRGHEKIKDISMIFMECLISGLKSALPLVQDSLESIEEQNLDPLVMKSAADAFHILMSDSEVCLNKKFHAIVRPLYKQRFFSSMMPIFLQLITKSLSPSSRSFLYRAFAHIVSDTPLIVIQSEAKKLIPILLDCLSMLTEDIQDGDILYGLLLVLSGILTNKNGWEAVTENAHVIINCLIKLMDYPHKMLVRETAIQCLVAMSQLPHVRIYPLRTQVLGAISMALDDKKRAVRHEAVRCRQAWASFASRSLRF
ncbi:PREDICTED: MMS19 nucleotide excision repair protein homolog [Lupinus angustifolius]|uniref:MMS19 nucleotide excision repair protein homolog n=1 Tax=Lupinus angustifolius TaxID=3871 RepID=UPI00092F70A1|nr:PREDICTED: MMS19 nucleotide excision repair protein homolog [Lupinus angustifolius]